MRRGMTAVDLVTLLALAGAGALVLVPRLRVDRVMRREEQVVAELNDLARRLEGHKRAATRDVDRDGVGEYAPLGDVLGPLRENGEELPGGAWLLDGYRYAVLVPAVHGRTPVIAGTPQASVNFAEVGWMIVAWPDQPGVTGMRAYAITPWGLLHHQVDGYPYGDAPPFPEGAMVTPDGLRRTERPAKEKNWGPPARTLREGEERPGRGERKR